MSAQTERREISYADLSELSRAGSLIEQAAQFVENMDATPSLSSPQRTAVLRAIRKLKEAQELIDYLGNAR